MASLINGHFLITTMIGSNSADIADGNSLGALSYKECSSKFRSKHISNTVLCLLRNLLEQSLVGRESVRQKLVHTACFPVIFKQFQCRLLL